jgi:hypothetical protein
MTENISRETDTDEVDLVELCETHGIINLKFTPISHGSQVAMAVTAVVDLDEEDFVVRVWVGLEDGRPSAAMRPRTWIAVDDEVFRHGNRADKVAMLDNFDIEVHEDLWDALQALIGVMHRANGNLEFARYMAAEYVASQLNEAAGDTWDEADERRPNVTKGRDAMESFVSNCSVDLFRAVTVTESADAHLGFDIAASTVDPATEQVTPLRIFWRTDPGDEQFVHCYGIGNAWYEAHGDDEDLTELLAAFPEESRHHYVHALDHLHEISHAAAEVADANLSAAVALVEGNDGPLSDEEVHQLSHDVYASTLVELNPLAWSISGEPELPGHER